MLVSSVLASSRCESRWSSPSVRALAAKGSRATSGRVRPLSGSAAVHRDRIPTERSGEKERVEDERRRVWKQVRMDEIHTEAAGEIHEKGCRM